LAREMRGDEKEWKKENKEEIGYHFRVDVIVNHISSFNKKITETY
jgi:hypothetical protein